MADWTLFITGFSVCLLLLLLFLLIKLSKQHRDLSIKYEEVLRNVETKAREIFEMWKIKELESQKQILMDGVRREFEAKLRQWKIEEEKKIREDAIKKSKAVIIGKVTEHLIPYFPDFKYNPRDARFIGTPVDFVVFDGMCDGKVRRIVFVEVKTGKTGQLSKVERQIRNIIEDRKIYWDKIHYTSK